MIVRKVKIQNINDALKIVASTNCDEYVCSKLAKKIMESSFIIDGIDNRAANILKQDALSCGCDVAVSKDVSKFLKGKSRAVICANEYQMQKLSIKIKEQPFGLKELSKHLLNLNTEQNKRIVLCANKRISLKNKPLVMGIVNLSQDSFFQNGIADEKLASDLALDMQRQGADIIDVGAESTRPGSKPLNVKDEIVKITKFLKFFAKKAEVPISVDTYKPEVAEAALAEGADIINDIYALRYSKSKRKMADVVAKHKAGVVLMHMKGTPLTMQQNIRYNNILVDIFDFFAKRIDFAVDNGIKKEAIIIDPGIGFCKTVQDNLLIIKRLFDFKSLNLPVLIGISNKSFLSKTIKDENLKERFSANISANVLAAINGADILRVHNVKEIVQSLKIVDAVRRV